MTVITRFAPSPTGKLHIGNARTALINFLYAKKFGGRFLLRIDDTDLERSSDEYKDAIIRDLKWLELNWDETFSQSSRIKEYEAAKVKLIASGRLYPCYETAEELDIKRKLQLSAGKPPIYDRSALSITEEQKSKYLSEGRKTHYRFKIEAEAILWDDLVRGSMHYDGKNISDPIVIREDGTMTYMLCSTVDDIDYNISHIIRGEDHLSNTAVQIQMFQSLGTYMPKFGHLSLVKTTDDKISKRKGGFEIESLRNDEGLEAMAINSFFANIGTSNPVVPYTSMESLVNAFDISTFSLSPTTYIPEELSRINHKIITHMDYEEILPHLSFMGAAHITRDFWIAVRPNISTLKDIIEWWRICHELPKLKETIDKNLLKEALNLLPKDKISDETWSSWTKTISSTTGLKGKELFLPLRLALTGMDHGPEMGKLLPLLGHDGVIARVESALSQVIN